MSALVRRRRLTVHLGNAHTHHHRALSAEIVQRAQRLGLAGATTLQGVAGFGHSTTIHRARRWSLRDRTPVVVHVVDTRERIDQLAVELADLADQCLIICDDVDVLE